LVRIEWYFKPPKISWQDREIVIGGIATERQDLDARLMLNAAERSVVGLAWFLALHLLQLIVVSHDDVVAESLAEELAPVGDWPTAVARIRCERDEEDVSFVRSEQFDESPRQDALRAHRHSLTAY
jgi:hypothetical protein